MAYLHLTSEQMICHIPKIAMAFPMKFDNPIKMGIFATSYSHSN
jgi:hypothetical protein